MKGLVVVGCVLIFTVRLIVSSTADITLFYFLFNKSIWNYVERGSSIYIANIVLEIAYEITSSTETALNIEITYVKPLILALPKDSRWC